MDAAGHQPAGPWAPRSGYEQVGGYVWLPRLLDKVRQVVSGAPGEYYALETSPIDQAALGMWHVTGDQIRAWVIEGLSDEAIADRIASATGADEAGRRAFTRNFLLMWGPALLVFDADEGRLKGPAGAVLRAVVPVFLGVRHLLVALGVTKSA